MKLFAQTKNEPDNKLDQVLDRKGLVKMLTEFAERGTCKEIMGIPIGSGKELHE